MDRPQVWSARYNGRVAAYDDYKTALATLRTQISSGNWDEARKQVLVCRTWLAELFHKGDVDGLKLELFNDQLDGIEKQVETEKQTSDAANNGARVLLTRTNYASR